MLYYTSLEERKKEKINKKTMQQYNFTYVYGNYSFAKFEPETITRKMALIDLNRFNELQVIIDEVRNQIQGLQDLDFNSVNFFVGKYDYTLRKLRGSAKVGFYRHIRQEIPVTTDEVNLITVSCADPELLYLQDHNYCINNNLNEDEYFNKKYGFYSKKLILMEAHTLMFYKKNNMLDIWNLREESKTR